MSSVDATAEAGASRAEVLFAVHMGTAVAADVVLKAIGGEGGRDWLAERDNEELTKIAELVRVASRVTQSPNSGKPMLTLDLPEYRESFLSQFLPHRWVRNMYYLAQTHSFAVGVALGLAVIHWGPGW